MSRPGLTLFMIALGVFVFDQVTKWFVVQYLDLINVLRIDVLPPYLVFQMAWNEGINFGIPLGSKWLLIAVALAISIGLTWWVLRRGAPVLVMAAGVVVGGAIGNVVDRVVYGAVADFLNMSCCGFQNPFSFNVADIAIFMGAVVIAWKA